MEAEACQSREHELVECLTVPPRRPTKAGSGSGVARCLEKENKALVELIAISRSAEGRAKLADLSIIEKLVHLISRCRVKDGHDDPSNSSSSSSTASSTSPSASSEERLDNLLLLLKLTRNLCAGDSTNQDAFLKHGGAGVLSGVAVALLFAAGAGQAFRAEDGQSNEDRPEKDSALERIIAQFESNSISRARSANSVSSPPAACIQMLLQLLGNFAGRGEACRAAVWAQFFPYKFLELAGLRVEEIREPLCMVLYTCCQSNSQRCWELCQDNGAALLALVFVASLDNNSGDDSPSSSSEPIEWLELLVQHLCLREPLFPVFFVNLGVPPLKHVVKPVKANTDDAVSACQLCLASSSTFTSLQAALLYVLCGYVSSQASNDEDAGGPPMPLKSLCFMVDILRKAAHGAAKKGAELSPVPPPLISSSCTVQVLGLVLSIWRALFASDRTDGNRTDLTKFLLSHGLVELLLSLLEALGPPEAPGKGEGVTTTTTTGMAPKDSLPTASGGGEFPRKNPYLGYRRDIVAVIANLAHRNPLLQDGVRETGRLLLVLQQCVVDKESPFLREWALWAMRNLLEGNEQNQAEISQLEVKESVNLPELRRMGLNVEIDPSTRRPRLVNESASSPQP